MTHIRHHTTVILITAYIAFAGFGLFMPMTNHTGHNVDCPFAPGGTAVCAAPFSHIRHWQDSLTAILVQTVLFVGFAWMFIKSLRLRTTLDQQYERYRLRMRMPIRPPLFQQLYSKGILNRKAP